MGNVESNALPHLSEKYIEEIETRNAIIENITISSEDHGVLDAWIFLDYGGSGQGFGGYVLYKPESKYNQDFDHQWNFAGHFIWKVMEVAGVTRWENLKGKTIRVKAEQNHIHAIGHIVKDIWFCPAEEFAKHK